MSANETHDHTSANYYSNDNTVGFELEKLKMTVRHLEEIIIQKDREIAAQGEIIALLKGQKEEVVGLWNMISKDCLKPYLLLGNFPQLAWSAGRYLKECRLNQVSDGIYVQG